MRQYLDLLQHILDHGVEKADRTGTGTLSVFGYQMRFNLSEGFPLLTTKKVWFKGVIEELLWFIRGETNVSTLHPDIQKWWTPWADEDGDLGPIYGSQFRASRWWASVVPRIYDIPEVRRSNGLYCGVGEIGNEKLTHCNDSLDDILKSVWREMLKRCYDPRCKAYPAYGAKGVHVDPEWLSYPNFKRDAQALEGWPLKLEWPDRYSLDKDILYASNRYCRETCIWASKKEQSMNTSTNTPFAAVDPEGREWIFPSIGDMREKFGVSLSAVHRCLQGKLHTHHGWSSFRYLEPGDSRVIRFREVDQLALAVATIKHSPDSRRIVLNLWHTPAMGATRLPCCHGSVIQFYVANSRLSCQMYQRSGDVFIGVPVNIASYSLLTLMIAQVCELGVGEFIHTLGDTHLYKNHIEQAKLQLTREPKPLPKMILNPNVKSIFDFKYEDFTLSEYDPHPHIKAQVAV
jgi:thymidylate synthase